MQHPGETIVLPSYWWHATCALADFTVGSGGQFESVQGEQIEYPHGKPAPAEPSRGRNSKPPPAQKSAPSSRAGLAGSLRAEALARARAELNLKNSAASRART